MKYRSEIDGLRAVAVVPVIFAHAKFSAFAGGFVGVDIFFVISGFLITQIIVAEVRSESFSTARFYERRARRIMPALATVSLLCVPFAYKMMMPDQFKSFGQSLVATFFFGNNVLMAMTSGYWALESDFKPLLHTWSLGVEEQFYIIFPLLCGLILRKKPSVLLPIILAIGAVSFALSVVETARHPDAAFYLLHTRAWELMVGAFCAVRALDKAVIASGWKSSLGLLMVIGSLFLYNQDTPYPSYFAAFPVLGSALILSYASQGTTTARVLSIPLLTHVGVISYSAYLWHQPVLAFLRIHSLVEPSPLIYGIAVLTTFVLAHLSWRFIEQPFRKPQQTSSTVIWTGSGLTSSGLIALGMTIYLAGGMPGRIFPGQDARTSGIYISYNMRVFKFKQDKFAGSSSKRVLVLGNSQARDVVNMIIENGGVPTKKWTPIG